MPNDIDICKEEKNPQICNTLKKHLDEKTGAIAFIASYVGTQLTPSKMMKPTINIPEELGVEDVINIMKKNGVEKILLLLNSLGGSISSSYKIARMLRYSFKDITVFIPHIAASGGTLVALTGNRIIMGDMSNISPIDVQVIRNGSAVSINAMIRSFSNLNEFFKDKHHSDVPYPWIAMADKLDPVEFQEWVDIAESMRQHAREIIGHENSSLKDKTDKIIHWLSTGCPTHSYSIAFHEAQNNLGEDYIFHCTDPQYSNLWNAMREWFKCYMLHESGFHLIRYILNNKEGVQNDKKAKGRGENKETVF